MDMDQTEREAIRAEQLDPDDPDVRAALRRIQLELRALGAQDPDLAERLRRRSSQ